MANNKVITPEGKTKMLQLAFINNTNGTFSYLALGGDQSSAATGGNFVELQDNNYERVILRQEGDIDFTTQSITLTAVFEDTNYNPSAGGLIKEIAIVDQSVKSDENDVFFAYAEVPEILKSDNISLKYSIVISVL